ncbi:hypothetical protein M3Y94_00645900 [Aphelenchoides besseyi]|nr:hypothetical protein M3Y94_00645900 [Aphelenchoides besseyi]
MFDASKPSEYFTEEMFADQKKLMKSLLGPDKFQFYFRLALGSVAFPETNLTTFNRFLFDKDVMNYIDSLQQSRTGENVLQHAMDDFFANAQLKKTTAYDYTAVFFVSKLFEKEVNYARQAAKRLQDEGIRVALVAHSNKELDLNRLVRVTEDPTAVFNWKAGQRVPSDDTTQWFRNVLACKGI